ncbi:MAG: hypothetical protein JWN96_3978 [Mycobacterium sp.]|jgi:hypothetical protein|nr:hypothetical protein [Mycobacterium sp.]
MKTPKRAVMAAGGALVLAAPLVAGCTTSTGETLTVSRTLSSSFVAPLQFAISPTSDVLVADSATSTLNQIGKAHPIAAGPSAKSGGDVAGVAIDPKTRAIAYTSSTGDHKTTRLTILSAGHQPVVADLSGFEKTQNPDKINTYGTATRNSCTVPALRQAHTPVSYTGLVDSHPYAVASLGGGSWAVADAGGNDILKVDPSGDVSLLSVLPPQPLKITAGIAKDNGLNPCLVGITYKFEPVPTDVEVGPQGRLLVTTLAGGPEGPQNGDPGSVYSIATNGAATRIAYGFAGATNLAVTPSGRIFVAQISSGLVAEVVNGRPRPVLFLPGIAGLEYANGGLYASTAPAVTGGNGPGTVVKIAPRLG